MNTTARMPTSEACWIASIWSTSRGMVDAPEWQVQVDRTFEQRENGVVV